MPACDPLTGAVQTEVFDGPLELLLYIVRREGIDLRAFPIAPITDAFLAELNRLEALELDPAAEFLVMATTLVWLKSREILPRAPSAADEAALADADEARRIKEELQRRLLDYRRYREAAEKLDQLPQHGRDVFSPAAPADEHDLTRPIEAGATALDLRRIFEELLSAHTAPAAVHTVSRQARSPRDLGEWLLQQLATGPQDLGAVLRTLPHPDDRVLAFIAALEMARRHMLVLAQDGHLSPIFCTAQVAPEDARLEVLEGALA